MRKTDDMATVSRIADFPEPSASSRRSLEVCAMALLPLALLLIGVFLFFGDEDDIAGYFAAARGLYPVATSVMDWWSDCGNIPFYLAYAAVFFCGINREGRSGRRYVLHYLLLLVLVLLVADMLKIWVGRQRPGDPEDFEMLSLLDEQHSFPSNHMTETVFSLLSLALFLRRRFVTVACGLGMATMGLTRLYLGRHHPTDLLAGLLLGCVAVYALWRLTKPPPDAVGPECARAPAGPDDPAVA